MTTRSVLRPHEAAILPVTWGDRIRYVMARRNLAPKQLAEKTGLSSSTIHAIIQNKRQYPTGETLELLSAHLLVSADWIMGLTAKRTGIVQCERGSCPNPADWQVGYARRYKPANCCGDCVSYYLSRDYPSTVVCLATLGADELPRTGT